MLLPPGSVEASPPLRSSRHRDWLVAGSLSNLLLYAQWSQLDMHSSSAFNQYQNAPPFAATYLAMIANWLLLTVLLWPLCRFGTRAKRLAARRASWIALTIVFLYALNVARSHLRASGATFLSLSFWRGELGDVVAMGSLVLLLALGVTLALRFRGVLPSLFRVGLTLIFPIALFHLVWAASRVPSSPVSAPSLALPPKNVAPPALRVVWVILDTLEMRSVFSSRPEGLKVPELDRLRSEGLFAERAFSPAARTQYSLPALLTGRKVRLALPSGGSELRLTFDGESEARSFSEVPNVFRRARDSGRRAGLVGWFHPYCAALAASLDRCFYHSANELWEDHPVPDLLPSMAIYLRSLVPRPARNVVIDAHERLSAAAEAMAGDPALDLVFVHLSIPHMPWIYDRQARAVATLGERPDWVEGYLGNVELADETVGRIRRAMESAGLWERSALIVSSDHWWWDGEPSRQPYRPEPENDFRIPFLLRAPRGGDIAVTVPFNTVLTHDLVLEMLSGGVETTRDAARWIEQNRHRVPAEPVLETRIFG